MNSAAPLIECGEAGLLSVLTVTKRAERCIGRRPGARALRTLRTRGCGLLARAALLILVTANALAEPGDTIRLCDELLITISSEQMIQHHATVAENGLVEIPGIGSIAAIGVTPRGLATSIEHLLRDGERVPLASVSIVRAGDPSCAIAHLPPARPPEKQPVPEAEVDDTNMKPEIELWLPEEIDGEPSSEAGGEGRRDPAHEDP